MADIKYNKETGQILITQEESTYEGYPSGEIGEPKPKHYIFDRGQYKINPQTGQVLVNINNQMKVFDGPYKIDRTIGGYKTPATWKYVSEITGGEIDPPITAAESMQKGLAQGVTLGFEDELSGAGAAAKAALAEGKSREEAWEIYKTIRDASRTELHEAQARHPTATLAGQIAGATPLAIATGGGGAATQIAAGTALGGAAGLGSSEAEDVKGMIADTATGMGTGAVLSTLGTMGTGVAKRVVPSGRAVMALDPVMDDVQAAIARGGRPAESSPIMSETLASAAQAAPIQASKYIPAAREALDEGYQRAITGIDTMLTPQSAVKTVGTALRDARQSAAQLYPDAYAVPTTVPLPKAVLDNPFFKQSVPMARKLALAEGRKFDLAALTTQDIHNIRQALDDQIDAAFRRGSGNVGQATKSVRDSITSEAYKINPKLQAADLDYAAKKAIVRATESGTKAASGVKPIDQIIEEFSVLSPAEKEGYRVGLATQLRNMMGQSKSGRTPEKFLEIPNIAKKLEAVGVPAQQIDDFVMTAQGKAGFADAIMSGSRTGKNIQFQKGIRSPLEDVSGSDIAGAALTSGAGAAAPLIRGAGRGLTQKTATLIVDALASSTPDKLSRLLKTSPQAYAPLVHELTRTLSIVAPDKVRDILNSFTAPTSTEKKRSPEEPI